MKRREQVFNRFKPKKEAVYCPVCEKRCIKKLIKEHKDEKKYAFYCRACRQFVVSTDAVKISFSKELMDVVNESFKRVWQEKGLRSAETYPAHDANGGLLK